MTPPFNRIELAVTEPGTAPKLPSLLIAKVPTLTAVPPL